MEKKILTAKDGFKMIGKGLAIITMSLMRSVVTCARWTVLTIIEIVSQTVRHPWVVCILVAGFALGMTVKFMQTRVELESTSHQCYILQTKIDSMEMKNFKYQRYN